MGGGYIEYASTICAKTFITDFRVTVTSLDVLSADVFGTDILHWYLVPWNRYWHHTLSLHFATLFLHLSTRKFQDTGTGLYLLLSWCWSKYRAFCRILLYRMIEKDGLNFVRLYLRIQSIFLNHPVFVQQMHNKYYLLTYLLHGAESFLRR